MKKKAKILIVDDHPVFRDGLSMLLRRNSEIEVCGEADSAAGAMEMIQKCRPDLAIVDITLKESSGFELIKDVAAYYTKMPVLVLSMHDEAIYAEKAIRAGAMGYVMKQEPPDIILEAIDRVMSGKTYLSEKILDTILRNISGSVQKDSKVPVDVLSQREFEVFELIGHGFETNEIADKLNLSVKTVQLHRDHIREKLCMKNKTELIQFAYRWVHSQSGSS